MILAKGNPHFVCDARVLVKPYKEKGKVPDKYRYSPFLSIGDGSIRESWWFCLCELGILQEATTDG